MNSKRLILAILLLLVGLVWIGQGAGIIGGSVMSGQTFWLLVGIVLVVAGAVVGWTARPRARP